MKLILIAFLIAVSAAARLEHLAQQQQLRQYLPPSQNSGFASYQGFGSNTGTYGSFGANSGTYGTAGIGQSGNFGSPAVRQPNYEAFPGVKNAYLPPKYESSAPSASSQFTSSVQGFGAQNVLSQQYGQQAGLSQFDYQAATQSNHLFSAQSKLQSQPSAVNRQYLSPYSSQEIPQQAFDEKTGYYY